MNRFPRNYDIMAAVSPIKREPAVPWGSWKGKRHTGTLLFTVPGATMDMDGFARSGQRTEAELDDEFSQSDAKQSFPKSLDCKTAVAVMGAAGLYVQP
jgi:hypothetical protein